MTKYSDETIQGLVDMITIGMTQKDACEILGVHESTFIRWMKNPNFANRITQARTKQKQFMITAVVGAANKDWKAAAWWLERKHPDEFVRKQEIEHTGKVDLVQALMGADKGGGNATDEFLESE